MEVVKSLRSVNLLIRASFSLLASSTQNQWQRAKNLAFSVFIHVHPKKPGFQVAKSLSKSEFRQPTRRERWQIFVRTSWKSSLAPCEKFCRRCLFGLFCVFGLVVSLFVCLFACLGMCLFMTCHICFCLWPS